MGLERDVVLRNNILSEAAVEFGVALSSGAKQPNITSASRPYLNPQSNLQPGQHLRPTAPAPRPYLQPRTNLHHDCPSTSNSETLPSSGTSDLSVNLGGLGLSPHTLNLLKKMSAQSQRMYSFISSSSTSNYNNIPKNIHRLCNQKMLKYQICVQKFCKPSLLILWLH